MGCVVLVCGVLTACAGSTGGSDCVSDYAPVASATTWAGLKDAMLDTVRWGRVDSVRVQARGHDVGAGDQDAVRVVDLLNRHGRRLVQVDVWRTPGGGWQAGAWRQCID
ncbi:N-acetyl-gamma-glutamyl-phosphate reductase [Nocardioides sp. PD653]|nr:N-acetyl-gamma-glutamyl-phosphate reductase [Nocardioides sp. PD653-B2]GAW55981.1 N-acetyl-gamma-glutamyl-phosphate reductase [Nocardioides sp. PD653]